MRRTRRCYEQRLRGVVYTLRYREQVSSSHAKGRTRGHRSQSSDENYIYKSPLPPSNNELKSHEHKRKPQHACLDSSKLHLQSQNSHPLELPTLSLPLLSFLKQPKEPLLPSRSLFNAPLISGSSFCSFARASLSVLSSRARYI